MQRHPDDIDISGFSIHPDATYKPYTDVRYAQALITPDIKSFIDNLSEKKMPDSLPGKTAIIGWNSEILNELDYGGGADIRRKTIYLKVDNDATVLACRFSHEFAHAIQAECGLCAYRLDTGPVSLSQEVYFEQQAEAISYTIFPILFAHIPRELRRFNSYMRMNDWVWLHYYYEKNLQNDLIIGL